VFGCQQHAVTLLQRNGRDEGGGPAGQHGGHGLQRRENTGSRRTRDARCAHCMRSARERETEGERTDQAVGPRPQSRPPLTRRCDAG
jgi:hypothetical protein